MTGTQLLNLSGEYMGAYYTIQFGFLHISNFPNKKLKQMNLW
jgi:hypothetical protein